MRTLMSKWLAPCALLALGCGTGGAAAETFAVRVRAVDDLGMPLANLQLSLAGASLGGTDARGERLFQVPGKEGQRLDLGATCPEAYTGPRERPTLLLSRVPGPEGEGKPRELLLTCESREHVAVVAVKTQPNLPILLHGQPVARTGATGTAHVMLREPPGSAFQLTLDTAGRPELRPESPSRVFTVTQRDAFAVWEQPFETGKKSPAKAPKKRARPRTAAVLDDSPPAP
jgi:hypothetical protein